MTWLLLGLIPANAWGAPPVLPISPGYVYRLRCQGRILASAVGDDRLVRVEVLPKEAGCGAALKALGPVGTTNLLLETTQGTSVRVLVIGPATRHVPTRLEWDVTSDGVSK